MVLTNCLNPMGLLQIFLSDKHRLITRLNCLRLIVRCLTHSCLRVHGADSTFRSSTSLSHSYFPHFDAPSFFFSLLFSNSTPQINLQFLPPFSYRNIMIDCLLFSYKFVNFYPSIIIFV